jgi:catechol 2,3-dioxygenase-like lactoylglutathione lyase family enzyme
MPNSWVSSMLNNYESGRISRRQFVEALSLLAAAAAAPAALASAPSGSAPTAATLEPLVPVSINHIAIGVSNINRSVEWYTQLLALKVVQRNEHYALLQFGDTQLVLRSPVADRPSVQAGTISHVMFGLKPYDEPTLKARLEAANLSPRKDLESFLIRDPDNLLVQIGDERLGIDKGYPPSSQ